MKPVFSAIILWALIMLDLAVFLLIARMLREC